MEEHIFSLFYYFKCKAFLTSWQTWVNCDINDSESIFTASYLNEAILYNTFKLNVQLKKESIILTKMKKDAQYKYLNRHINYLFIFYTKYRLIIILEILKISENKSVTFK